MGDGFVGISLHEGTQRGIVMGLGTEVVVFGPGQRTIKRGRSRFGIARGEQGTPLVVQCGGGGLFVHRRFSKPRGGVFKLVGAEGFGAFDHFGLGVGLREQGLGAKQHQGECRQGRAGTPLGTLGDHHFQEQEQDCGNEPRHQEVFVIHVAHGGDASLFEVVLELQDGRQLHKSGRGPGVGSSAGLRGLEEGGFIQSRDHGLSRRVGAESRGASA